MQLIDFLLFFLFDRRGCYREGVRDLYAVCKSTIVRFTFHKCSVKYSISWNDSTPISIASKLKHPFEYEIDSFTIR